MASELMDLPALVQSASWSLMGLSVGWGMCKTVAVAEEIKGSLQTQGKPRNVSRRTKGPKPMRDSEYTLAKSQRRWRILGVFLMLMGIAIGLTTWQSNQAIKRQNEDTSRRTACQAQYNADFAVVVAKRAQWANEDKAAETKLWKDFLSSKPGSGDPRKILQDYLDSVTRTDNLRATSPLPKLTDRNC